MGTGGPVVGSGGTAGSRATGGAGGQTCGPAAPRYVFTREKIRSLPSGMFGAAVVVQSDGAPLFLYADETLGNGKVWATHRPQTDDGGISVAISYQVTRPHTGGRMGGL
ncbi:MAG: hypothetical protein ACJ8F1_08680, partial [Polyangia bacterium]